MDRLVGRVVEQLTIAVTRCFGLGSRPAFGELSFFAVLVKTPAVLWQVVGPDV